MNIYLIIKIYKYLFYFKHPLKVNFNLLYNDGIVEENYLCSN